MAQAKSPDIGPARISFPVFLMRILAGSAGGAIGTMILLLIFFLASSLLEPLTSGDTGDYISPIFVFLLLIMVFISSTASNILSTLFLALTQREQYKRLASAIYQIFIISIIIFLLMAPVYFATTSISISMTAYAVALHIIISAQVSALVLEIVANYKYSLLGVYSSTFSIIASAGFMFILASFVESPTILLFLALPIVWGSFAFLHSIVTMIYGGIARLYDRDFLSTQTLYGKDYGKEIEDTVAPAEKPKAKDSAGADFLRKN